MQRGDKAHTARHARSATQPFALRTCCAVCSSTMLRISVYATLCVRLTACLSSARLDGASYDASPRPRLSPLPSPHATRTPCRMRGIALSCLSSADL